MRAPHMRAPHMQAQNADLALQSPQEAPALREHPVQWQTETRQRQVNQRQILNRAKAREGMSREDREDREDRGATPRQAQAQSEWPRVKSVGQVIQAERPADYIPT